MFSVNNLSWPGPALADAGLNWKHFCGALLSGVCRNFWGASRHNERNWWYERARSEMATTLWSEIRKAQNVKPLLRIERSQLRWFGNVSRISQERLARQVLLATHRGKQPRGLPRTRWRDYISGLAWSCLGVGRGDLSEIAVDREVFRVLLGLLYPQPFPKEKRARKWMNEYEHWKFLFIKLSLVFLPKSNIVFY